MATDTDGDVGAGIFDGFEGYRTATSEDVDSVLTDGLVVLDTNVLLNLYRYSDSSRHAMVAVLGALGDRLWIPHQVMREFWRNRERALSSPRGDVAESVSTLRKQRDACLEVLSQWVNRGALADTTAESLKSDIDQTFRTATDAIEALVDARQLDQAKNTANDAVLLMLEPVLKGKVGCGMSQVDYTAAVQEGQRRADAGEPPGFGDAKAKADRGGEGAAGDYLVWEQVLVEAEKRKKDVLLVTGDVNKGDWWRREGTNARGPRNELVQELKQRAGTRLFMLRPEELLTKARTSLSVDVQDESVLGVERVDRSLSDAAADEADESSGWTLYALQEFLNRLTLVAPAQAAVLRFALEHDGYVSREDVYRIAGFGEGRQLKGFTRPINRITQHLKAEGRIADGALDVLQPVYDKMTHGFGWVDGFRVPDEILNQALDL